MITDNKIFGMGYLEVQAFVYKVKISESLAVRFAVYVLNPMISKKLMKNCDKVVSSFIFPKHNFTHKEQTFCDTTVPHVMNKFFEGSSKVLRLQHLFHFGESYSHH